MNALITRVYVGAYTVLAGLLAPLPVSWVALWAVCGTVAFTIVGMNAAFSWSYLGNAAFEFLGSLFLLKNVYQLSLDKMVRGYHWHSTAFFASWGFWNLHYYPAVHDWYSFTAGIFIVTVNTLWLGQMYYYRKN